MRLEVSLAGGVVLSASEVFLVRELGEPTRWRFTVAASSESWSADEPQQIRRALLTDNCRIKAQIQGGAVLGPELTVTGARHVRERVVDYLEIEAEGTAVKAPDPFVPRRRVHRVRNFNELFDRLGHVAEPIRPLRAKLQGITFPDKERTSLVQDGVPDWLFLFHVIDQCRLLAGAPAWLPLVVVGSVDENQGTAGRFIVTPGSRKAYEEWNTVGSRTIKFDDSPEKDGVMGRFEFGSLHGGSRVPQYPAARFPTAVEYRPHRRFDAGRWQTWRTMDLPRFTDPEGAIVWGITDRIYYAQGKDVVAWESWVSASPPALRVSGPERASPHRPWLGLGTVEETSAKGPWIKVKLPGFEADNDLVDVRLGTPYSGKNGARGLHMVPERGTELLVGWTGRFDQSIVSVNNARSQASELASPSTYLESEHTAHYANVHVKKVADVTVDSDFTMAVKQQTSVSSSRPMKVKADGADLNLRSGTVYTGRGL